MFGLIFGGWWYFFIFFFLLLKIQQTDMKMQIHVAFLVRWHGSHSVDLCTNPWWAIPVCANTYRELLQNMEEWEKISSLPPQGDVINSRTLPPELCPFPDNLFFSSAFWSLFLLSLGEKKTTHFSYFYFHGSWDAQIADGSGWEIFGGRSSLGADSAKTHQWCGAAGNAPNSPRERTKIWRPLLLKSDPMFIPLGLQVTISFEGKKKSGKISHFP